MKENSYSIHLKKNSSLIKGAPKKDFPMLDIYDYNGQNPYEIEEVLPGKIWRVGYNMENFMYTQAEPKQGSGIMGMDPRTDEFEQKVLMAAEEYGGQEIINVVRKDLETARSIYEKSSFTKEDLYEMKLFSWSLNMIVVKLNSGGLLLYTPVRVHKEANQLLTSFLQSLGPVEWLVVASGAHTLCLPDVIEAFPNAKIVGPKIAEEKLKYSKVVEKFDYLSDKTEDVKSLNDVLEKEGVEIFNIEGDVAANAVMCLVQKEVMLECDLLYGHQNGEGFLNIDEKRFKQMNPEDFASRLFKLRLLTKPNSPNGFLPNYRFWCMDPNSLGVMLYEQPAKDGSSCTKMAKSLRKALSQEYNQAVGTHFNGMSRDEFQGSIDSAWNWLDGKSLK